MKRVELLRASGEAAEQSRSPGVKEEGEFGEGGLESL